MHVLRGPLLVWCSSSHPLVRAQKTSSPCSNFDGNEKLVEFHSAETMTWIHDACWDSWAVCWRVAEELVAEAAPDTRQDASGTRTLWHGWLRMFMPFSAMFISWLFHVTIFFFISSYVMFNACVFGMITSSIWLVCVMYTSWIWHVYVMYMSSNMARLCHVYVMNMSCISHLYGIYVSAIEHVAAWMLEPCKARVYIITDHVLLHAHAACAGGALNKLLSCLPRLFVANLKRKAWKIRTRKFRVSVLDECCAFKWNAQGKLS